MNFEAIQPALVVLVAALAGLNVKAVAWKDEPRPMPHDGRQVLLSWVTDVGVGVDEIRFEDPEDEEATHVVPVVVGNRVVALQVQIETQNTKPNAPHALALAERVRTRLARPSTFTALQAINLGLIGAGVITLPNYESNQRVVATAVVEIRFNATVTDRDTDDETQGVIEHAEITTEFAGEDGTQLPASVQAIDEVIPPIEEP